MHPVIEEWFDAIKSSHLRGKAQLIRFADDMVFSFERQDEARRFYEVLPNHLAKAGLEIHTDKSQIIHAERLVALHAYQRNKHIPTFNFLGFVRLIRSKFNTQVLLGRLA